MKKKNTDRAVFLLSLFLLAIVMVAVISVCAIYSMQFGREQPGSVVIQASTPKKVFRGIFGQIEIPKYPQRVVVLDDHTFLDPVLALGVKPIGIISCEPRCTEAFRGIPDKFVSDIASVGTLVGFSIEKILILKPDLILADQASKNIYSLLSVIAPTIITDYYSVKDFKKRLRYFAEILGKSENAEKLLVEYQHQVQQLREKLSEKSKLATVSVLYVQGSQIAVSDADTLPHSQIIRDLGLNLTQAHKQKSSDWTVLNIEALPEYDADYMFIITSDKSLSFLKQPIWSALKAVQNKRVYAVNWDVGGPIGANRVIDDLEKYLVNTPAGGSGEMRGG
jgi:iron complex transport system substrate-binding protein